MDQIKRLHELQQKSYLTKEEFEELKNNTYIEKFELRDECDNSYIYTFYTNDKCNDIKFNFKYSDNNIYKYIIVKI
ncbi:hypothetical protein KLL03_11210, partial [Clostridioides difficile]|nr:hypothetical protein [Clostridioides difficile]